MSPSITGLAEALQALYPGLSLQVTEVQITEETSVTRDGTGQIFSTTLDRVLFTITIVGSP